MEPIGIEPTRPLRMHRIQKSIVTESLKQPSRKPSKTKPRALLPITAVLRGLLFLAHTDKRRTNILKIRSA